MVDGTPKKIVGMNPREFFFQRIAQTSPEPMLGNPLQIVRAKGSLMWDEHGKEYLDFISGIAVSSVGHCHPEVVKAIKEQADRHLHLMVYGEFVQMPQNQFAEVIFRKLPAELNQIFYTTGGSEAVEIAIKAARKFTGRKKIVSFRNSYHGSTLGALSLSSLEHHLNAFAPHIPGIVRLHYNNRGDLQHLNDEIACVVLEPIQAESGITIPDKDYLEEIRNSCNQNGILLVFDEIQTGFGRTGKMFGFEHFGVTPDMICLAKGMGGGVPVGACIARSEILRTLSENPVLGHMNTFGGNALACSAALATLKVIEKEKLVERSLEIQRIIERYFFENFRESPLKWRMLGAFGALEFENEEQAFAVCRNCLKNGLITDWFLYNSRALRLAPPLNIEFELLDKGLNILIENSLKIIQKCF
jgi:acetylornithine/succinyldiaminopimelate/putrescine aminotransferase